MKRDGNIVITQLYMKRKMIWLSIFITIIVMYIHIMSKSLNVDLFSRIRARNKASRDMEMPSQLHRRWAPWWRSSPERRNDKAWTRSS